MILKLGESLEVPLRDRNDLLTAVGFAPVFKARPFDDPQMSQVMSAVRMMLSNHEPFPALAIDRAWNIRMSNNSFDRLSAMIDANVWARVGGTQPNSMRMLFHPDGIKPFVRNWTTVASFLWSRAQREAEALGGDEMKQVLDELGQYLDATTLRHEVDDLVPVLPLELSQDGLCISLFTVISIFGTAQDITADELRIESLFPADDATEQLLRSAVE